MANYLADKVRDFFLAKTSKEQESLSRDYDLLEMPLEAVLAYWLSVKKVLDTKGHSFLGQEEQNTSEIYIRHLLGLLRSSLSAEKVEKFAGIKKKAILDDLRRKFIIMSISILGMSTNENPQKVLIRMVSKFPVSPVREKQVLESANTVLEGLKKGEGETEHALNVDHRLKMETLILNLIVYNMLSRRLGRNEMHDFAKHIRSFYFAEGLSYIIDGFDYDFIKYRLNLQKREILDLTDNKMDMSLNMCAGIKSGWSYNDLKLVGYSYLI